MDSLISMQPSLVSLHFAKLVVSLCLTASFASGCSRLGLNHPSIGGVGFGSSGEALMPNPMQIPNRPPEFVWNQVIDTLDNYFAIDQEQQVQKSAQYWMEGAVTTLPKVSSGYLEAWRRDATPGFQRLQSTLQTIRRTATVRLIPNAAGYSVSVVVNKELEDVDRSQSAGESSATARHDGSVVRSPPTITGQPVTLGWIEQERDVELEQRILQEIQDRVSAVEQPKKRLLHH